MSMNRAYQQAEAERLQKGHRSMLLWAVAAFVPVLYGAWIFAFVSLGILALWALLFIPAVNDWEPGRKRKPVEAPQMLPLHKAERHCKELAEWEREFRYTYYAAVARKR